MLVKKKKKIKNPAPIIDMQRAIVLPDLIRKIDFKVSNHINFQCIHSGNDCFNVLVYDANQYKSLLFQQPILFLCVKGLFGPWRATELILDKKLLELQKTPFRQSKQHDLSSSGLKYIGGITPSARCFLISC